MSLRTFLRLPLVVLVTLLAHVTIFVSAPLKSVAPRRQLRIRNTAFRRWGRRMSRIMGMRITVEGSPPSGRFFMVANHVSYVDIILLASQVGSAFVAKADLRGWPLLGWIFATADTIFIDRARKKDLLRVMALVKKCLDRGLGVLIFPEGTSGKGQEVLRLKPSLLQLAADEGYPVHYATLSYRTNGETPAHRLVCWWDATPFVTHFLRLLGARGFEATLRFGTEPVQAGDRKALAEKLRAVMAASFTPVA